MDQQDTGISTRMSTKLTTLPPPSYLAMQPPGGLIRLEQAENCVIRPELLRICKDSIVENLTEDSFCYPRGFGGEPQLRDALASFFNTYFDPSQPVEADHITTTSGSGNALDALLCTICDEGDIVLTPGPCWQAFGLYAKLHASVTLLSVPSPTFRNSLTADCITRLTNAYDSAPDKTRIKALIICNPHNPCDEVYSVDVLRGLMEFCHERGLHYISDEVGSLSAFNSPEQPFVSALSLLGEEGGIRRSHVHVLWSGSKDFGSPGMREACLISQDNKSVIAGVTFSSFWQTSVLSSIYFTALLKSPELPTLIKLNSDRLKASYELLTSTLDAWGLEYIPVRAGVMMWVQAVKNATTWEEEADMIAKLRQAGVLVAPGRTYGGIDGEKGWVRILFAVQLDVMKEAIKKMEDVMKVQGA